VAPSPYKVHKLVLFRGERRAVSVSLYSIVVISGLQLSTVLCCGVSLGNKVRVIYKAEPQRAAVRALEFL